MNQNENLHHLLNATDCLPDNVLADYVQQRLSQDEIRKVELHLADCIICSDVCDGLTMMKTTEIKGVSPILEEAIDQKIKVNRSKFNPTQTYWAIAASLLLIIAFGWLVNNNSEYSNHSTTASSKTKRKPSLNHEEQTISTNATTSPSLIDSPNVNTQEFVAITEGKPDLAINNAPTNRRLPVAMEDVFLEKSDNVSAIETPPPTQGASDESLASNTLSGSTSNEEKSPVPQKVEGDMTNMIAIAENTPPQDIKKSKKAMANQKVKTSNDIQVSLEELKKVKNFEAALQLVLKALEGDDSNCNLLKEKGELLVSCHRIEEAIVCYKKILRSNCNIISEEAGLEAAALLLSSGKSDEAKIILHEIAASKNSANSSKALRALSDIKD